MLLIWHAESEWVPNGTSEQPQRKSGIREGFRASGHQREVHSHRPKMAEFLGFPVPVSSRRDCPCRTSWRRERNCRQTLSAAFSMTYEPHQFWMLTGESRCCHGGPELRADEYRAGRATAKPDLSESDAFEPATATRSSPTSRRFLRLKKSRKMRHGLLLRGHQLPASGWHTGRRRHRVRRQSH